MAADCGTGKQGDLGTRGHCKKDLQSAYFSVFLNALRLVFKRLIYVVRKILSREMKHYSKFTHISNTVDIYSVCRDFG